MIFENVPLRDTNVSGPFSQIAAQEFNNNFISGMKYCFECLEKSLMSNIQSYHAANESFPAVVEERLKEAKKELFKSSKYVPDE